MRQLSADRGVVARYRQLLDRIAAVERALLPQIGRGAVVAFEGDYGPGAIAALLALAFNENVVVPLSLDVAAQHESFLALAEAEYRITGVESSPIIESTGRRATHPFYAELRARRRPGLILFSSGLTGSPKCALHDLSLLLRKFQLARRAYRTLVFLQLDHIGGINTLFYTLANGGTAVVATDRSPAHVCSAIEQHRVQLLPTSPTFLNLLLLSGEYLRHDLSSLELVTDGTEPMPEATLRRVVDTFPGIKLLQTYGLSELGILRSQSRSSDSLWVRVGGEGFETKVVDGRLWVRAESAMLGYLNAPSPFDADGFFDTGDMVDVDGEWIRLRGRQSDIINVGGNKVYPQKWKVCCWKCQMSRTRVSRQNVICLPGRWSRPPLFCRIQNRPKRSSFGCVHTARGASLPTKSRCASRSRINRCIPSGSSDDGWPCDDFLESLSPQPGTASTERTAGTAQVVAEQAGSRGGGAGRGDVCHRAEAQTSV